MKRYTPLRSPDELRSLAGKRRGVSLAVVALVVYIPAVAVGATVYSSVNGWGLGTSVFYVAQALAGNMFNTPEDSRETRWLTLALFLFGSSIYAAAMGAFISSSLEDAVARSRAAYAADSIISAWSPRRLIGLASLLWLLIGCAYGVLYEGLDSGDALFFALGTFSASGSPPPICLPKDRPGDCALGAARTAFVTAYVCVGVPLFQALLSSLSFSLINDALTKRELEQMVQPLCQEDLRFALAIHKGGKAGEGRIDLSDFILMELLRIRRVSMQDVEEIKELFSLIDRNGDGEVDVAELARCHLLPELAPAAHRRLLAYQQGDNALPPGPAGRRTTIS